MRGTLSVGRARRWRVAARVGMGVVCAMLFLLQAAAHAGAAASNIGADSETAGNNHAAAQVNNGLNASLGPGTHYIYAQDGTCPDGIDAFKVSGTTLTNIQTVGVGCSFSTFFGQHHLAVVRTPSNCLLFADGDGNVYSFTIAPNSGLLSTSPASTVKIDTLPTDTSSPRFFGGDLVVSGSTVFLGRTFGATEPLGEIDVLTVGGGCTLTLDSENPTGSELDVNFALYNPTTVVSADANSPRDFPNPGDTDAHSGDIVAYTLQPDNTLIETAHDHGQIPGAFPDTGPDGVAVLYGNVYTGQATSAPPLAQGFSFDGSSFTPVAGSPQTANPETSNGSAMAGSAGNHILIQANQFSGQISWYNLAGGGGRMSSGGDTPLQNPGLRASQVTVAGNNLFVAQNHGGDLEDCALAPDSVSNCHSIATLTGAGSGVGGSAAIF
jgi:hypothetical protein